MVIAANIKTYFLLYNKNNKIIVKLNNNILAKKIKKQIFKKFAYRINIYLINNNITITKIYITEILSSGDIAR